MIHHRQTSQERGGGGRVSLIAQEKGEMVGEGRVPFSLSK